MSQTKNVLDATSLKKSIKGLLIACTGGAALAGLNYIGTIEFSNPNIVVIVAILVPALVNLIREIIKGEKAKARVL